MNKLRFETLRKANLKRIPTFTNNLGQPAHTKPDGSDWTPAQWFQALSGEMGEYANWRKKFERGDINEQEFNYHAKRELADVACYLDILAYQLGIDLGEAIQDKFNEVSQRIGGSIYIEHDHVVDISQ